MEWLTENLILPAAATIISAAIAWAAAAFQRWTGIQVEAKHRDALHSALMTGVRMAVQQLGPGASKLTIAQEAVGHVRKSVPDAINYFDVSSEFLVGMAEAKLQEVLAAFGVSTTRP